MDRRRRTKLLIFAFMLNQRRKKKTKRAVWVKDFFSHREKHGEYRRVFCQIKENLHMEEYQEKFYEYTRMTVECWTKLYRILQERSILKYEIAKIFINQKSKIY